MSDSPFVKAPIPKNEQPILDKLLQIRAHIELLKGDKSTYVKSSDVIALYGQVIEQVHALNEIRIDKRTEQNRLDTVLDDCFQLISLAFLTIGKKHEAPAVYSFVSTVKRLLDHLKEASFFSPKDLHSIEDRLQACREIIARGKESQDPDILTLLEARVDVCDQTLGECQGMLSHLTPEMTPTYEKLVSILRSLSACNTKSKFPNAEVKDFQAQLREIEASIGEEKLVSDDINQLAEKYAEKLRQTSLSGPAGVSAPSEHTLLVDLLHRCLIWSELIKERQGKIDERFGELYNRLLTIKTSLDKLQLTYTWSMRETDLWNFQRQLDRIDEQRVEGNWLDYKGQPADLHAQRTLLYLLRKSYALIFHLLVSSEPVSEALQPIYNQLNTLKRCLLEVKKAGGVSNPRELYPYSMKVRICSLIDVPLADIVVPQLNSIDNMRVDGKFMVGDDIPDGQGSVNQLLAECFDLAYDLRAEAESEKDDANDEGIELNA